jgi:HEAT repeat protein
LTHTLKDENEAVRAAGVYALSAVGISAVPALLHAIEHEKGLAR